MEGTKRLLEDCLKYGAGWLAFLWEGKQMVPVGPGRKKIYERNHFLESVVVSQCIDLQS